MVHPREFVFFPTVPRVHEDRSIYENRCNDSFSAPVEIVRLTAFEDFVVVEKEFVVDKRSDLKRASPSVVALPASAVCTHVAWQAIHRHLVDVQNILDAFAVRIEGNTTRISVEFKLAKNA